MSQALSRVRFELPSAVQSSDYVYSLLFQEILQLF